MSRGMSGRTRLLWGKLQIYDGNDLQSSVIYFCFYFLEVFSCLRVRVEVCGNDLGLVVYLRKKAGLSRDMNEATGG